MSARPYVIVLIGAAVLGGCAASVDRTPLPPMPIIDAGPPHANDAAVPMYPECGPSTGPAGSWRPLTTIGAPQARWTATTVSTGTQMIVWAGQGESGDLVDGASYDIALAQWRPISALDAVAVRYAPPLAAWTGTEMIFWNGLQSRGYGYDLRADRWRALAMRDAPVSRGQMSAIWTGSVVLVWGGLTTGDHNECAKYDPVRDEWTRLLAPREQSGRGGSTVIWTGREMIVWGGYDLTQSTGPVRNDGWRYDPQRDVWSSVSMDGAPSPRNAHVAVWSGSDMIVWGGHRNVAPSFSDGARYHPDSDTWTPMAIADAPSGTLNSYVQYSAVWTGREMIVWSANPREWTAGGRYDPATDHWAPLATDGAPAGIREGYSAVWASCELIVWGGRRYEGSQPVYYGAGARWRP